MIVSFREAPKRKGREAAPIFKGRTRSTLTVRTEGQELDSMLEDWGATDIRSNLGKVILILKLFTESQTKLY